MNRKIMRTEYICPLKPKPKETILILDMTTESTIKRLILYLSLGKN